MTPESLYKGVFLPACFASTPTHLVLGTRGIIIPWDTEGCWNNTENCGRPTKIMPTKEAGVFRATGVDVAAILRVDTITALGNNFARSFTMPPARWLTVARVALGKGFDSARRRTEADAGYSSGALPAPVWSLRASGPTIRAGYERC